MNYFQIKSKTKRIIMHICAWCLVSFVSTLEFSDDSIKVALAKFNPTVWIVYASVFYIGYLYLTPYLLLKRKNIRFVLLSIATLIFSFIVIKSGHQMGTAEKVINYHISNAKNDDYRPRSSDFFFHDFIRELNNEYPGSASRPGAAEYLLDESVVYKTLLKPRHFNPFGFKNVGISYSLLFVLSLAIIIRFLEKAKRDEELKAELEKAKITTELEYLKQQINPHFLFNALNSIYSLTLLNSEISSDAVLRLSSILRYMLYHTNKDRVMLSEEVEVIDNYLALQKLRLTDKTQVNFVKTGDFDTSMIEPMLLIPILENAFKYGIDSSRECSIDIALNIERGKLKFTTRNWIVKNSGDDKDSGIGLKNIKSRLNLIYGSNYRLKAAAHDGYFDVELVLNIQENC